jgi:SAM-dependent methyltransferase
MIEPSEFDNSIYDNLRNNLSDFVLRSSSIISQPNMKVLEIGSQDRSEIKNAFQSCDVKVLDLDEKYNPDIIGDITKFNSHIEDSSFDVIACLEVLEHTVNPFMAINELRRILKDGGYLMVSAPLNFRIHGPIPDCWRFTEYGWRILLKDFDIIEFDKMETPNRNLFPIKYNILAKCNKSKNVDVYSLKFDLL